MHERRKHPRYERVTRVDLRLAHPRGWIPALRGNTVDVSHEGLAVALYEGEDTTQLIQSLLSEDQSVELALELPTTGDRIRGKGVVRWMDIGPVAAPQRYMRAGIFLREMDESDRVKWGHFVEDTARMARQEASAA